MGEFLDSRSEALKKRVLELGRGGSTQREILEQLNVPKRWVSTIMNEAGLSPGKMKPIPLTPEHIEQAKEMFRRGSTIVDVSKKLGVTNHYATRLRDTTRGPALTKLVIRRPAEPPQQVTSAAIKPPAHVSIIRPITRDRLMAGR